jgi:predicted hotdog family 3-hydroxylacyl-ACP dehydratase
MNCREPNSPDSFDLCAALDAPDTYYNLKNGMFDHFSDELSFFFDLETPPKLLLLKLDNQKVLAAFVYNDRDDVIESVWESYQIIPREQDDCNQPCRRGNAGGPYKFSTRTTLQLIEDNGVVWGLNLLDTGREDGNLLPFSSSIPADSLARRMSYSVYPLHCVLGGDMDFLHTVLGLQGCSASYPCYLCLIALSTLRDRDKNKADSASQARTRQQMQEHLDRVNVHPTMKERKVAAKSNGSVMRKALIPADPSRVLIAVLHIILGITKKIFDLLTIELQQVDNAETTGQRKTLSDTRNVMLEYTKLLEDEEKALKQQVEEATAHKDKLWADVRAAAKSTSPDQNEEAQLRLLHKEACRAEKEKKSAWSERNKHVIPSLLCFVQDINVFLEQNRGYYEGVLEQTISNGPIKAKHNPFYNGAFNGNDCMRLLAHYQLLFKKLREASQDKSQDEVTRVKEILCRHEKVFAAWARVVPTFRSTTLLPESERLSLIEDIAAFWDAYIECTSGSVTVKLHFLIMHTKQLLFAYGTIGFWAEDAVESIHAIVNLLARRYAALDPKRRAVQVFRSLHARQQEATANHLNSGETKKTTKRARNGGAPNMGTSDEAGVVNNKELEKAASAFLQLVQDECVKDVRDEDEEDKPFPSFELKYCSDCKDMLQEDTCVPDVLQKLHNQLCHADIGDKFVQTNKKAKHNS